MTPLPWYAPCACRRRETGPSLAPYQVRLFFMRMSFGMAFFRRCTNRDLRVRRFQFVYHPLEHHLPRGRSRMSAGTTRGRHRRPPRTKPERLTRRRSFLAAATVTGLAIIIVLSGGNSASAATDPTDIPPTDVPSITASVTVTVTPDPTLTLTTPPVITSDPVSVTPDPTSAAPTTVTPTPTLTPP